MKKHLLGLSLIVWLLAACRQPEPMVPDPVTMEPAVVAISTIPAITPAPATAAITATAIPSPLPTAEPATATDDSPTVRPPTATPPAIATIDIARQSWSTPSGRIAFTLIDPATAITGTLGTADIYMMKADGSAPVRLTDHPADEQMPSWSPDGEQIAFISDRDGNLELYLMNNDGSEQRRLTNQQGEERYPLWSPDGSQLAFRSERDGNHDVYLLNLDSGELTRLTDEPTLDTPLAWSPDGARLAYVAQSLASGSEAIHAVALEGGERIILAGPERNSLWSPGWSPDGQRLAFMRGTSLFLAASDGSGTRELALPEGSPPLTVYDWSPDGQWLLAGDAVSSGGLYLLRADGALLLPLAPAGLSGYQVFPDWAPAQP